MDSRLRGNDRRVESVLILLICYTIKELGQAMQRTIILQSCKTRQRLSLHCLTDSESSIVSCLCHLAEVAQGFDTDFDTPSATQSKSPTQPNGFYLGLLVKSQLRKLGYVSAAQNPTQKC
jgi:hypothetical protein